MSKRNPLIAINGNMAADQPEYRSAKSEKVNRKLSSKNPNQTDLFEVPLPKRRRSDRPRCVAGEPVQNSMEDRRVLRSHYLFYKNLIHDEKEELCTGDSNKFQKIMGEVDRLFVDVSNPSEQVADAETLLEMANTLVSSARSYSKDGLTPSHFICSLFREFGSKEKDLVSIKWDAIGVFASPIFKNAFGCPSMIGPMNTQLKPRKFVVRRKRTMLTVSAAKPEQLEDSGSEHKKDTDKNMATMFNILRSKKRVNLENLVLNRSSFAQTVENLFALSFLVKDGRAQIVVDDNGTHLVSPRNAPQSELVTSGEVLYHHFVFRFDFKDWKLMVDSVASGEELMPHRYQMSIPVSDRHNASPMTNVQSS